MPLQRRMACQPPYMTALVLPCVAELACGMFLQPPCMAAPVLTGRCAGLAVFPAGALAEENALAATLQVSDAFDELMLAHKKEVHCNIITSEVGRCSVVADATCRAVKTSKTGTKTLTATNMPVAKQRGGGAGVCRDDATLWWHRDLLHDGSTQRHLRVPVSA